MSEKTVQSSDHASGDIDPGTPAAGRRVTVITGASGGIGADLARVFARRGHDVFLVSRNGAALETLAREITMPDRPRPLVFPCDLSRPSAVQELGEELAKRNARAEILVNNAGFGLNGPVHKIDQNEQLEIIDLNVRAAAGVTLSLLPQICAARGKILNVASIAGYFPGGPGMAVYYASKAFLLSFSRALSQELRPMGVSVTALCPGYTKTGFQARAGIGPYDLLSRLPGAVTSMAVAEAGYAGLMAGQREIVPGILNKLLVWSLPFLPKSVILDAISRLQQKRAAL
ncbi:MAG TPA: SDR family oxidoreductase [Methylocella sp.]|nr:SDR family oxidoreductase [Methylocella sp.]